MARMTNVKASESPELTQGQAVRQDGVQSVRRAVRILSALSEHPYPMGVKELSDRLHISTPAVHRMLSTLASMGWVEQNVRSSRYRVGTNLLGVGAAALITHPVVQNGRIFLERLSEETGCNSLLSTLVGGRVVHLARVQGRTGHEVDFVAGVAIPAHASSAGKLLLAYLPEDERRLVYEGGFRQYTERTITDVDKLEMELESIRQDGFAVDRGERWSNHQAVAAPIFGTDKRPLLAMMCTGNADLMKDLIPSLPALMTELTQEMTEQLTVLGDMPKIAVDAARFNLE